MQFMMFVCTDTVNPGPSVSAGEAVAAWVDRLDASGQRVTGAPIASEAEAVTVRVRDGRPQTARGAVLRTGDVLLGFDILDCRDRDEAIKLATQHPLAARGVLEIRALE